MILIPHLPPVEATTQINILCVRFEANSYRHKDVAWEEVEKAIKTKSEKIRALCKIELSGGEPDVVGLDTETGDIIFFDCSKESPSGRRSIRYDRRGFLLR